MDTRSDPRMLAAAWVVVGLLMGLPAPLPGADGGGGVRVLTLRRLLDRVEPATESREEMERVLEAYRERYGMLPAAASEPSILPRRYPIYPFGGIQDVDVHAFDYVDLDPSAGGRLDWDCGDRTYDGHDAVDFWLRSFGEQDAGVPVFATLAGRVAHAQDGHPDHQKQCSPGTENYVVVDHGGGMITGYGHLGRGSVRVVAGQQVEAGEELGRIASSGCSYWPHLHFRTEVDGRIVEPHTGACNPGASGWRAQRPIRRETWVWDVGFSHRGLERLKPRQTPPDALPRLGRIGRKDRKLHLWAYVLNLAPATPARVRAFAPDGSLAYDSGTVATENEEAQRLAVVWFTLDTRRVFGRHWGTWTIEASLNDEVVVEAPIDFGKKARRKLNRPPARPAKVVFEPRRPAAGRPLACVVEGDRLLDDPDYDIVSYFFEWSVNGEPLRERTWAARSDVLPAGALEPGERVACTVVPLDGELAGEARGVEAVVR